jgi:hypothetical protein
MVSKGYLYRGLCIGKYPPPLPGISADVSWGNYETRGRDKREKCKRKEERRKIKRELKLKKENKCERGQ